MARLVKSESLGKAPVYDVTTEDTHCFFASSGEHLDPVVAHNSQQLTKGALDRLLKPMEDNIPGSPEKKLLCIFCTTEPERMRGTILSRCAPAFFVEPLSPQTIATRLAYICEQEGVEYEPEVLPIIAQTTQSHIRDAIKAVEAIARTGPVTRESCARYLHLDLNALYARLLLELTVDVQAATLSLTELLKRVSPVTCYIKLADVCLLAYQVAKGMTDLPPFWDTGQLQELARVYGPNLLNVALHFSDRPGRPTKSMLVSDLMLVADSVVGGGGPQVPQGVPTPSIKSVAVREVVPARPSPPESSPKETPLASFVEIVKDSIEVPLVGLAHTTKVGPVESRVAPRVGRELDGWVVPVKDGRTPNGVYVGDAPLVRRTRRRRGSGRVSPKHEWPGELRDESAASILRTMVAEQGKDGCVSSNLAAETLRAMVFERTSRKLVH